VSTHGERWQGAACIGKWELFDGEEVEDEDGKLICYDYPHLKQARALCRNKCPLLDQCRRERWLDPGVIIAGKTDKERRDTRDG